MLTEKQRWQIIHFIYAIGQHRDYLDCIRTIRFLTDLPLKEVKTIVDEIGSAQSLWKWKGQLD